MLDSNELGVKSLILTNHGSSNVEHRVKSRGNGTETRPYTFASPDVGSVMRERIFNNVDLPAPFLPMIPSTSPSFTSKEISRRAQMTSLCDELSVICSPLMVNWGCEFESNLVRLRSRRKLRMGDEIMNWGSNLHS